MASTIALTSPLANVDWSSVTHKLDCSAYGSNMESVAKDFFDVTGDGAKEAFVLVSCKVGAAHAIPQIEVFDGNSAPSAPRLLDVLIPFGTESEALPAATISASGTVVTFNGGEWSPGAVTDGPDIEVTQTYTWSAGKFQVGEAKRVHIGANSATPSTTAPPPPDTSSGGGSGVGALGDRVDIPGRNGWVSVTRVTRVPASGFENSERSGWEYVSFRIGAMANSLSSNSSLTREDFKVQTASGEDIYSADDVSNTPGDSAARMNDGSSLDMNPDKATSSTLTFQVPTGKPAVLLLTGQLTDLGGWSFNAP